MPVTEFERLLAAVRDGDGDRFDELVSLVYGELRQMARAVMGGRKPGVTLQPTALVNEAYLRLVQGETNFQSRAHFFGAAARAMRQVLVAYARKRNSLKRAGGAERITLSGVEARVDAPGVDVLALHEGLEALAETEPRLAHLLELRYFSGLGLEEIAEWQQSSLASVKRDWAYARAWLFEYLSREAHG